MTRRLGEATVNAIADLAFDGVLREEDVRPAFAAAGIAEVPGESYIGDSETAVWFFPATAREDIKASLSALDLSEPGDVRKVLKFAARLVDVYSAANDADRVKIVRLRNALADDGYELETGDGRMAGYSVNTREIARMMRDIQRQFDKHPIRVPVDPKPPQLPIKQAEALADETGLPPDQAEPTDQTKAPAGGTTTIHNAPVIIINGDGAQVAWDNLVANQTQQSRTDQVAPGFEALAQAVAKTLEGLPAVGLSDDDRQEAEAAANEVLTEVTRPEPNRGKVRRALMALKGFLAPVATGLMSGSAEGAQEWARTYGSRHSGCDLRNV